VRPPTRETTPPTRASRPPGASKDAQRIALAAAEAGLDKKASEVEIVDVTGKVDYADFLVLMTGHSDRHVAAIAEAVDEMLSKRGFHSISVEGLPRGEWVLLDFVDVVVHVFQERSRSLYDLDGLWMDARRIEVPNAAVPHGTA
jgi:ribosome-associated protein